MIVDELIRELQTYPEDWPVRLEVNGVQGVAQDVDLESNATGVWVTIHDYTTVHQGIERSTK